MYKEKDEKSRNIFNRTGFDKMLNRIKSIPLPKLNLKELKKIIEYTRNEYSVKKAKDFLLNYNIKTQEIF